MKKEKLSLKSIKMRLTNDEMKKIMAGSSGTGTGTGGPCPLGTKVWQCYDFDSGLVWTVAWCCGPTPEYVGNVACEYIGTTPGTYAQENPC